VCPYIGFKTFPATFQAASGPLDFIFGSPDGFTTNVIQINDLYHTTFANIPFIFSEPVPGGFNVVYLTNSNGVITHWTTDSSLPIGS
jgi:hypothetical protein